MTADDWIDYLIHSSVFVGIVGVAMVVTTSMLLSLPIHVGLLGVVGLISFAVYNFNRSTDEDEDAVSHPERTAFVQQYRDHLSIIATASYIAGVVYAFVLGTGVGVLALAYSAAVALYSIPWIPVSSYDRLKEIFAVKNMTVAGAWAMFATFLPVVYFQANVGVGVWITFSFIFLKVFGNTVTFDIRDVAGDRAEGIITLPVRLGVQRTTHILTGINWAAFILIVSAAFFGILPPVAYAVSAVTVYTQAYISRIGETDMTYIADILADGEYVFMGILAVIGGAV